MRRLKLTILFSIIWILFLVSSSLAQEVQAGQSKEPERLWGNDRYETAISIATELSNALTASVLAYSKEAPMLLLNKTAEVSNVTIGYIRDNAPLDSSIYLIGDNSLIGKDFIDELKTIGYNNIYLIQGKDKYETDLNVAKSMNIKIGTPIVVSSGEKFPDALSISSFAAKNGWPILLTKLNTINDDTVSYIKEKNLSSLLLTIPTALGYDNYH